MIRLRYSGLNLCMYVEATRVLALVVVKCQNTRV
jgi:hypothetical protein